MFRARLAWRDTVHDQTTPKIRQVIREFLLINYYGERIGLKFLPNEIVVEIGQYLRDR
jgi:hypothetical protein